MKMTAKVLFFAVLAALASGCRVQKDAALSSAEHQTALEALQEGSFLVKLDAVYPSSASPYQRSSRTEYRELHESYFTVDGGEYASYISFEDRAFLADDFPVRKREGLRADVSEGKRQRNGEVRFRLRVYGGGLVADKHIAVFLDGKSNRCYVRMTAPGGNASGVSMSGHVYPAKPAESGTGG